MRITTLVIIAIALNITATPAKANEAGWWPWGSDDTAKKCEERGGNWINGKCYDDEGNVIRTIADPIKDGDDEGPSVPKKIIVE